MPDNVYQRQAELLLRLLPLVELSLLLKGKQKISFAK